MTLYFNVISYIFYMNFLFPFYLIWLFILISRFCEAQHVTLCHFIRIKSEASVLMPQMFDVFKKGNQLCYTKRNYCGVIMEDAKSLASTKLKLWIDFIIDLLFFISNRSLITISFSLFITSLILCFYWGWWIFAFFILIYWVDCFCFLVSWVLAR